MENELQFPLDFTFDKEEGVLSIFLVDSTLTIYLDEHKRCSKFLEDHNAE